MNSIKDRVWCALCNEWHYTVHIKDDDGLIRRVILSEAPNEESNHSNLDLDGIDEPDPAA